ncbi:hypothetical protein [Sphingorhabdus sp.]|uniref:hypothetical protein n=1 Tax=Sphingorhabdus sp. TaxID=1902408 RepID=UPI0032B7DAF3
MRTINLAGAAIVLTMLSGCASSLNITGANGNQVAGVPFRATQVYLKTGVYKKHSKLAACIPAPFVETESLPTGEQYFAQVDPAEFAKTGFSMKFNDVGGLSEISLNTEPSSGDLVKNSADALKSVLPLLGIGAAAAAPDGARDPSDNPTPDGPACDTGADPASIKYSIFVPN